MKTFILFAFLINGQILHGHQTPQWQPVEMESLEACIAKAKELNALPALSPEIEKQVFYCEQVKADERGV